MIHRIIATVIFVQDLPKCQAFYQDTLKLQMQERDAVSASFLLDGRFVILLEVASAAELLGVEPSSLQMAGSPRQLLAASVDDVDATYEDLMAQGVTSLRPPTDQPWGLRTAHFADPEGNIWEINQPIASNATS